MSNTRGPNWSPKETEHLLAIMGSDEICQMMEEKYTHGVYKKISLRLASIGFNRDEDAVEAKIKALKNRFYKVSFWFNLLDQN